jgi:hypothetical protein
MNFIAKHLNAFGLLLLTAFVATAAGMYFNVPARLPKSQQAVPAAHYSCPMHPEVVAHQPGECPRCGMALTTAAKSESNPMTCQHADSAAPGSVAASDQGGCNHAPEAAAGGCCSKRLKPAADVSPGGCTRDLQSQPANPSE